MKLLTAEEVAAKLRVKVSFVKDRTRKNCREEDKIPCIRLGRWVRFNESEIDAWIQNGCKSETPNPRPLKIVNK